ncbi:8-amino-7-oxononanoate synthase [Candidatus Sumerlaeota bacterium]
MTQTPNTFDFIDAELEQIRDAGLLRSWRVSEAPTGPRLTIDGRQYDNFCSNNYLGLADDPEVIEAAQAATRDYGAGSGAARLICGTQRPVVELERELARFKQTEAALVFSSGYLANLGTVAALVGPEDAVIVDRLAHASLLDAARLSRAPLHVFRHNDADSLAEQLERGHKFRRRLILVDGVYSMDGDIASLGPIRELAEQHDAMLLVDDAHGTGAIGPDGRGALSHCGLQPGVPIIQMGTLSKALGSLGGFIAGERRLIDLLINRARTFIYDTALPAAAIGAARKSLELIERQPERIAQLQANAQHLRDEIGKMPLAQSASPQAPASPTPIIPIILGDADRAMQAAEQLRQCGIFVTGIRPPTVKRGASRLRLTAMSSHTPEQLERLLEALRELPL